MPLPLVDFTGIGENATDVVLRLAQFPARDGKTETVSREIYLGGQVATAVAAVAKWGLRTRYVGAVGTDDHAQLHQAELRKWGVESHLSRVPGAESRLSYILVDHASGSRAVVCHRDRRVKIRKGFLQQAWFERTRLLHLDGEDLDASRTAASWARHAHVPVMCDLDAYSDKLRLLLPQVDFPVLSSAILQPLTGSPAPLSGLPHLQREYRSSVVCVTLGEKGALAWDGRHFSYAPAYRVAVVDTTGAGDLFHAGFAYGILQKWDIKRTLEFACAAAGLNCSAPGARGGIGSLRAIERLRASGLRHAGLYSASALAQAAEIARRPVRRSAKR